LLVDKGKDVFYRAQPIAEGAMHMQVCPTKGQDCRFRRSGHDTSLASQMILLVSGLCHCMPLSLHCHQTGVKVPSRIDYEM
jgi:hypothetical protein